MPEWGEPGYEIEDRFRPYSTTSGEMRNPGTRCHRVTPSDAIDGSGTLPFRCRYFKASQDALITVRSANGEVENIFVDKGRNWERIDQVFALDYPPDLVIVIWD